jgi:hypothetical protein
MIIRMDDSQATTLEQIRALVIANGAVQFAGQRRQEVYEWVERTLVRHEYAGLSRPDRGIVRLYLAQMTGLSRAQVARLISKYQATGRVTAAPYQRALFSTTYTAADVELLAYVDRAHGNLSGPATRRILQREYGEYGQAVYQRLARISVVHLYRLRGTDAYRRRNATYQPTRPTPIPHRGTSQAATARFAGIPARRHGASRRPGWSKGRLSHQCRRRSHPMGDRGSHPANLRTLVASGIGSDASEVLHLRIW